jgi:hypothetical protein
MKTLSQKLGIIFIGMVLAVSGGVPPHRPKISTNKYDSAKAMKHTKRAA